MNEDAACEVIGFVVLVLAPDINGHNTTLHFLRKLDREVHDEITVEIIRISEMQGFSVCLIAWLRGWSTVEVIQGAADAKVFDSEFPDLIKLGRKSGARLQNRTTCVCNFS